MIFYLVLFWMIAVSVLAFILYACDKKFAKIPRHRRIPERALLLSAFFGGGFGAFLAMYLLRHKTKHLRFEILVPLFLILQIILLFVLYKLA